MVQDSNLLFLVVGIILFFYILNTKQKELFQIPEGEFLKTMSRPHENYNEHNEHNEQNMDKSEQHLSQVTPLPLEEIDAAYVGDVLRQFM